MSELLWIRSHVELLLGREWGFDVAVPDDDGDYVYSSGTALCWVSILESSPPMVRVSAHSAYGVKSTAALLRELNAIQARVATASVMLLGDVVMVAQTISPIGLTQPVLVQALEAVGDVAGDIGPLIAAVHGGRTPLDADLLSAEEVE